jgi:hypothetical protein
VNGEASHLAVSSQGGLFRDFHDGMPMLIVLSVVLFLVILRMRR